jgi:hypothetical protein
MTMLYISRACAFLWLVPALFLQLGQHDDISVLFYLLQGGIPYVG